MSLVFSLCSNLDPVPQLPVPARSQLPVVGCRLPELKRAFYEPQRLYLSRPEVLVTQGRQSVEPLLTSVECLLPHSFTHDFATSSIFFLLFFFFLVVFCLFSNCICRVLLPAALLTAALKSFSFSLSFSLDLLLWMFLKAAQRIWQRKLFLHQLKRNLH